MKSRPYRFRETQTTAKISDINTGLFSLFRMAASNTIMGRTFLLFNGNEMRSKLFNLGHNSVCGDGPCSKGPVQLRVVSRVGFEKLSRI
jgi:hypothetical protein